MPKIKVLLREVKTTTVSENLYEQLYTLYKVNYLKLVEIFLEYKHRNKLKSLKDNPTSTIKNKNIYIDTLDKLKEKYSDSYEMRSPIVPADFEKNLKNNLSNKVIYNVASISGKSLVPHILKQDTTLKAIKSAGLNQKNAAKQLDSFFKGEAFKDIAIYLEVSQKSEKYHGLMDYGAMSISINCNNEIFKKVLFFEKDMDKFLLSIEEELAWIKRSVYHELQHLYVYAIKKITGFKTFGNAPRKTSLGDIPDNDPEEVQTYAQNPVSHLKNAVKKLIENEKNNLIIKQYPQLKSRIAKIIIKNSIRQQLSEEDKKILSYFDTKDVTRYYNDINSELVEIKEYNTKMYNYVLNLLYTEADKM